MLVLHNLIGFLVSGDASAALACAAFNPSPRRVANAKSCARDTDSTNLLGICDWDENRR
jgi:hypothetical protein